MGTLLPSWMVIWIDPDWIQMVSFSVRVSVLFVTRDVVASHEHDTCFGTVMSIWISLWFMFGILNSISFSLLFQLFKSWIPDSSTVTQFGALHEEFPLHHEDLSLWLHFCHCHSVLTYSPIQFWQLLNMYRLLILIRLLSILFYANTYNHQEYIVTSHIIWIWKVSCQWDLAVILRYQRGETYI